jgi:hypothetical protein
MRPSRRSVPVTFPSVAALVVLGWGLLAGAADTSHLSTDRDAFTPSVHTVGAGRWITEFSHVYIDNITGPPTNNYPELLVRRGVGERFELRFGVNYGAGSQGNVVTNVEVGEGRADGGKLYESSLLYGFKVDLTAQDGWRPQSCFIMEGATPTSGELFGTTPVATTVAGWELPFGLPRASQRCRLDGALRYAYVDAATQWFDRWTPSVVLRMPVTERWEVHAEWFGSYTAGLPADVRRAFFSPGTHVLLTENFEVGLRVGWGVSDEAAPFFSDAGVGWRW